MQILTLLLLACSPESNVAVEPGVALELLAQSLNLEDAEHTVGFVGLPVQVLVDGDLAHHTLTATGAAEDSWTALREGSHAVVPMDSGLLLVRSEPETPDTALDSLSAELEIWSTPECVALVDGAGLPWDLDGESGFVDGGQSFELSDVWLLCTSDGERAGLLKPTWTVVSGGSVEDCGDSGSCLQVSTDTAELRVRATGQLIADELSYGPPQAVEMVWPVRQTPTVQCSFDASGTTLGGPLPLLSVSVESGDGAWSVLELEVRSWDADDVLITTERDRLAGIASGGGAVWELGHPVLAAGTGGSVEATVTATTDFGTTSHCTAELDVSALRVGGRSVRPASVDATLEPPRPWDLSESFTLRLLVHPGEHDGVLFRAESETGDQSIVVRRLGDTVQAELNGVDSEGNQLDEVLVSSLDGDGDQEVRLEVGLASVALATNGWPRGDQARMDVAADFSELGWNYPVLMESDGSDLHDTAVKQISFVTGPPAVAEPWDSCQVPEIELDPDSFCVDFSSLSPGPITDLRIQDYDDAVRAWGAWVVE